SHSWKELALAVPRFPPASFTEGCKGLAGEAIRKICFCFESLTLTSFHSAKEQLTLLTPNLGQSLLTVAGAESIFFGKCAQEEISTITLVESLGDEPI